MTQMQSPYQDQTDVTLYQEPERTSIMAIMSLIFGVGGCCLGLTSIPALLLGVFSLVGISKSKGRVGGTGFSIAGILIGLLTLAIWIGILFGGSYMFKTMMTSFGDTVEQVMLDVQADNFDGVRGAMGSPGADVPDEELVLFREAYRSTLGDFVSKPDGMGDMWGGYLTIGPLIQPYNGRPGYIPIPMHFDSGWGLVIYVMDMQSSQSQAFPPPVELIVIDQQGNEYHLPMAAGSSPAPELPDIPADEAPRDEVPEMPEGP